MVDRFREAPDDLPEAPPLDVPRLLEVLNRHEVDYVVVGGFAVIAHGSPRATFDLDITMAPARENLQRLAAALEELDAHVYAVDGDLLEVDPTDPEDLARGANWTLVTDAGRLDVLADLPGAPPYEDLRRVAVEVEADAGRLVVAGFGHLIRMKQASGRDKDLADIAALHRARGL